MKISVGKSAFEMVFFIVRYLMPLLGMNGRYCGVAVSYGAMFIAKKDLEKWISHEILFSFLLWLIREYYIVFVKIVTY